MLFSPASYKNLSLKNRLVWLPIVSWLAEEDGYVTDKLIDRYRRRAEGDVGLIVIEATGVLDRRSPRLVKICDDKYLPGLEKLVKAIHDAGAKVSVQLIHYVKKSKRTGWKQQIEDLTKDDIEEIEKNYVDAAIRAKKAGFDAIELHVAHSYTLASFVSLLNKRKDEYGGDENGRARIVLEIMERCREAVSDDFAICARISGEEFVKGGNTLKQTGVISRLMAEKGLNYLSVSAGGKDEDGDWYTGYSGSRSMPTANLPFKCHTYLAKGIKEEVGPLGVPVIASGKIHTLEHAEEILNEGKADLIGLARPLLADPQWAIKLRENRADEIVECTYCNTCLKRDQRFEPVECIEAEKAERKSK
jgi:dimethylglycine catabolism A